MRQRPTGPADRFARPSVENPDLRAPRLGNRERERRSVGHDLDVDAPLEVLEDERPFSKRDLLETERRAARGGVEAADGLERRSRGRGVGSNELEVDRIVHLPIRFGDLEHSFERPGGPGGRDVDGDFGRRAGLHLGESRAVQRTVPEVLTAPDEHSVDPWREPFHENLAAIVGRRSLDGIGEVVLAPRDMNLSGGGTNVGRPTKAPAR